MKRLLVLLPVLAVVFASAAFAVSNAQAFCMDWDCVTPSPWVQTPPWLGSNDQSCDNHGGVASDSVEWVWRGAVLVKLVHVTCADGHTFTLEEGGDISYTEPEPAPYEDINCWEEQHQGQEYCY